MKTSPRCATVVDPGGPCSRSFHVIQARDPEVGKQVYPADAISWVPVETEDEWAAEQSR